MEYYIYQQKFKSVIGALHFAATLCETQGVSDVTPFFFDDCVIIGWLELGERVTLTL